MNSNFRIFILILAVFSSFGAAAANVSGFVGDAPKYVFTDDERFNKTFREGRELIDAEKWLKAAEKFNEIVCDCPDKQSVDAAFYWLAFCYKKLGRLAEMNLTVERLLKNFPNSSWADDARILQLETRAPAASTSVGGGVSYNFPPTGLNESDAATTFSTTNSVKPLEREDEIRLAAFQSLYQTDPKRAIAVLGDLLKGGSKASESLKHEILRSLRNRVFWGREQFAGNFEVLTSTQPTREKVDFGPLREALISGFQTESNPKIKAAIMITIASFGDEQSLDFLSNAYRSERDKETKKSIVDALAWNSGFFFTYATATAASGNLATVTRGTGQSRTTVSRNVDETKSPRFSRLLVIFRAENDPELKGYALSKLQTFAGWSTSEGIIEALVQQYDSESNEVMKLTIINSFANIVDNERAFRKLLDVAKNDKSDKLRLAAIRSLRGSKNPEVAKFLEELIK